MATPVFWIVSPVYQLMNELFPAPQAMRGDSVAEPGAEPRVVLPCPGLQQRAQLRTHMQKGGRGR